MNVNFEALLYALQNDIYPILDIDVRDVSHDDSMDLTAGTELMSAFFAMHTLTNFLAAKYQSGHRSDYYSLEFDLHCHSMTSSMTREKIQMSCRYLFLHGMFDSSFWQNLCAQGNGPVGVDWIIAERCAGISNRK